MQIIDLRLVIRADLVGAIGKYRAQAIHRLTLLDTYLVRMHLMSRCDLLHREVSTTRIERNLGFETSHEPASFRHLHIPPQGAEYTLNAPADFLRPPQTTSHWRFPEVSGHIWNGCSSRVHLP